MTPLHGSGHLGNSEVAVRPRPRTKISKNSKRRRKKSSATDDELIRPAAGTLTRTKSLLLAALKVWELKNGIRD